ncbi:hypothetical protein GOODEAATRI_031210 [Goodea atripinnis]|uniref:Uncharacterized protein n=1 Tax=Goodea atripinnis TaxID=208336 RepID=A0ABV0NPK7_9TELE
MNHYVTGVIVFGKREVVRRNSRPRHVNAADGLVFLLDPSRSSKEQEESDLAVQILMAVGVIEAFPDKPSMTFSTTKPEI